MREQCVSVILHYSLFCSLNVSINSWYYLCNIISWNFLWSKSFIPEQLNKYVSLNFMILWPIQVSSIANIVKTRNAHNTHTPRILPRIMQGTVHKSLPSRLATRRAVHAILRHYFPKKSHDSQQLLFCMMNYFINRLKRNMMLLCYEPCEK